MNVLTIAKGKEKFLDRRHPWIFSGAIASDTEDIEDGALVEVHDKQGNFYGIGFFQPGSIAVRLISFEPAEINQDFWNAKIQNAVDLRIDLGLISEENTICRLVHGEGDGVPGLIIDFYNGVAVIQSHAVGVFKNIQLITEALKSALGALLIGVYDKSSETLPQRIVSENSYLFGTCQTPHLAKENGQTFSIDWITGQKTGFFIDQRDNRTLLGNYSKGKKVLNTFCYSGGFSIYALNEGAAVVHSLDSSKKAIELVERNLAHNTFKGEHKSIVADAVKYMNEIEEDYDVIVLDPPAFAKHMNKRHQAIKAYTRLNANAIRQIKKGGIIFTFSCSQVVDAFQFQKAVIAAAIECKRNVRILHQLHQPADHPVSAFHPEGNYLKGLVIQVD
jgi:23S rRNA (cytosine1962-C5)-methyltransferase